MNFWYSKSPSLYLADRFNNSKIFFPLPSSLNSPKSFHTCVSGIREKKPLSAEINVTGYCTPELESAILNVAVLDWFCRGLVAPGFLCGGSFTI